MTTETTETTEPRSTEPNMSKFEMDEVNCPDSFVTVSIRGDLIGTIAKCLKNCGALRCHFAAARSLGEALALAGDMIYRQVAVEDHLEVADCVVSHDGLVHETEEAA